MCTLVVGWRAWAGTWLLVAGNRDERLGRPAGPPRLHRGGPRSWLGPEDLQAGGTWLGLSSAGLFAGLTNRFGAPPVPGLRSRGALVVDALGAAGAGAAARALAGLDPRAVNRFHLLLADRAEAHLVWSDGARVRAEPLAPGVHVLTERSLGAAPGGREARVRAAVAAWPGPAAPGDDWLQALLAQHDPEDPFEGTCVHADAFQYGTRSATRLWLPEAGAGRLLHREGPPCRTPPEDLSALLAELRP